MLQAPQRPRRIPRPTSLRGRQWTAVERTVLISVLAIVMGSLFVTTYSMALGDPVPHRIDAAVLGDRAAHARTIGEVQTVAAGSLVLAPFHSLPAALRAVDEQRIYATIDVTSKRPTLYVASAAGASVARVLERISAVGPTGEVVDTRADGPLGGP